MKSYRQSILPFFAVALAILGICYSACHDSKADTVSSNNVYHLKQEMVKFEEKFKSLKAIHENQLNGYVAEMGCNTNSQGLEIINKRQAMLDHFNQRLQYHKLQMIQADTTNAERNDKQLKELQSDIQELTGNEAEIRKGMEQTPIPMHVTK
jgi:hypothetical protein